MQTVSALYTSIITGDNHWFECKLEIRDPSTNDLIGTYGQGQLFSMSTNIQLLKNTLEIGNAVSGEVDIKMVMPSETIPTMAKLMPYVRVCNDTQQSEWLHQGVYYIDTREHTVTHTGEEVLVLHGYDAMLKADQLYPSTSHDWPYHIRSIVSEIAGFMGVEVDSRTYDYMPTTASNYAFPLPANYTLREVLGYIGSICGGNWIITEEGKLRLIPMWGMPIETNLLINEDGDVIIFGDDAILVG